MRNCRSSCLGTGKWFSKGAARDIRGKTGRGRLVYFGFFHTLLFPRVLMHYLTFLSITLPRLNNSSLSSVSDGYWCTHFCPFHPHFSYLKTLYSFLWNVKKLFPEACGSLGLLWEKKPPCRWLNLPSDITEGSVTVFCCCSCYYLNRVVAVHFLSKVGTLLHSLYRDGNLRFLLFNLMNCGNVQS